MDRYIVRNKITNLYLDRGYYRSLKRGSRSLGVAHKFSLFELILASKTILKNKQIYLVYNYRLFKENTILGDLYD